MDETHNANNVELDNARQQNDKEKNSNLNIEKRLENERKRIIGGARKKITNLNLQKNHELEELVNYELSYINRNRHGEMEQ